MNDSTAPIVPVQLPEPSGYGAYELKKIINKYTLRSFYITIIIMAVLIGAYLILVTESEEEVELIMPPPMSTTLTDIPDEEVTKEDLIEAPPEQMINTGPAAAAGKPVAVPDAELPDDTPEYASFEEIDRASAEGGTGEDLGGFSSNIDFSEKPEDSKVEVKVKEEYPEPDAFIPVEKEPGLDLVSLQKLIVYPDLAKRSGVEGKVFVRALINKRGKLVKAFVEKSDNQLLNEAALDAVKKYKGYTAAIQNKQPVDCWVTIPISFVLR